MKRNSQTLKHEIFSHYGLFTWQECLFCKEEFRRENGYRFTLNNRYWSYSCEDCSCSKSHCSDMIDVWIKNQRPDFPPTAPPVRTLKRMM